MGDITTNFNLRDFQCHCPRCADNPARPHTKIEVINELQVVRDVHGKPMVVSRGVSCAAHNKEVGGASDSRHLPEHADAVDIECASSAEAYDLVDSFVAYNQHVTWTLRVYKDHVHADRRPGPPLFIASPGGC